MDLSKLPIEIVEKIKKLVHKPQPRVLLDDIENYYLTKRFLRYFYTLRYLIVDQNYKEILINFYFLCDILVYVKYTLKNYKNTQSEINKYWGRFSPDERLDFIIKVIKS
jgi:hypothetical protein